MAAWEDRGRLLCQFGAAVRMVGALVLVVSISVLGLFWWMPREGMRSAVVSDSRLPPLLRQSDLSFYPPYLRIGAFL